MSHANYLLGVDVSTTSAKALLIDDQGQVIAGKSTPLSQSIPRPLWSEQDPHEWWNATTSSIRRTLQAAGANGEQVLAVGLTGQMHGLTLLDAHGEVLRPAILWNDQRTAAECEQINQLVGEERLLHITGNHALTGFTAPKILWIRNHEPQVYNQTAHILLPKDYVRLRLSGEYATDKADGSGTILFDLQKRDWSAEILDLLNIPRSWLPPTFEGPQVSGVVSLTASEETGLKPGTPIVGGAGDQAAQAVGVGAVEPGLLALTLGTSGVIFAPTQKPFIESAGRLHAFCHALPDTWHLMSVMLSAAGSLQWYRDVLAPDTSFDELLAPARDIPPGAEGLLFLPYLTGERTPHPDPLARAAFIGLTARHTQAHMTRAVLEGVAFGLRDNLELIHAAIGDDRSSVLSQSIRQVRVSGGGAKGPLWLQILADVLNVELTTVNTTEGAAFGASLLAGVGIGLWPSIPVACQAVIRTIDSIQPQPTAVQQYTQLYPLFRDLYPALKSTFDAVA